MADQPQPCVCGHDRDVHDHYRPGTDCGACGKQTCPRFRAAGGRTSLLDRLVPGRTDAGAGPGAAPLAEPPAR